MVNLYQLYPKLDVFSIAINNQFKNKDFCINEFGSFSQNAIFKKQRFELAETKENKEKAAILQAAVCIGDA